MRILFLIARHCNMLLQVKEMHSEGHDNKAIGAKLNIHPYIVKKYLSQASRFSSATLREAVKQCVEAEEAVKSGRMNDMMSVEILITTVL